MTSIEERAVEVRALRTAADDAEAYAKDRKNKVASRIALKVASAWLRARADEVESGARS